MIKNEMITTPIVIMHATNFIQILSRLYTDYL